MKGHEIIELLGTFLQGNELIVGSNGNISRQVFHCLPRPQVYLRGSMGLPMAVGLGLAISQPDRKVIVITGDGNFLMGLGSMSTVSSLKPSNLKILIIDNELYATTGGQPTVSSVINYETMIRGIGVETTVSIQSNDNKTVIQEKLNWLLKGNGLQILHVKVQPGDPPFENIPWHPKKIKNEFMSRIST
ncbi:thiamine pyrophosphate-dependent enzyme [Candidatus Borrarchaeum sp.]|uniref:thiamine pyrophosphate-dependent enzyme n=1 Tax=Candidatus Borrarchaeum sp. TaxID=2846742 RepID=UPI00257F314F|nr:thiamine pyrophosphate-dependent enzyme [Candidatus Borrarchaeum sp.]